MVVMSEAYDIPTLPVGSKYPAASGASFGIEIVADDGDDAILVRTVLHLGQDNESYDGPPRWLDRFKASYRYVLGDHYSQWRSACARSNRSAGCR